MEVIGGPRAPWVARWGDVPSIGQRHGGHMARETIVKTTVNPDGSVLFEFPGLDAILVRPEDFPPEIRVRQQGYGIREKGTNAAALPRDTATGQPATPQAKRDAVKAIMEAMKGGAWELRGPAISGDTLILIDAIVEATKQPREAVRETVMAWTPAERVAVQDDAAIRPTFQRMKKEQAQRAAVGVDTKALLAKFAPK